MGESFTLTESCIQMITSLIPDKPSTPKEDQSSKNLKDNWVKCGNINLDLRDKNTITSGKKMTDMHINAAQQLLKRQFKNINGLQSTLLQKKLPLESIENAIQILHVRNDHWAVVTTVGLTEKEKNYLRYYDSAYSTLFEDTEQVIVQLFGPSRFQQHTLNVQIMVTPRQFGSTRLWFVCHSSFNSNCSWDRPEQSGFHPGGNAASLC